MKNKKTFFTIALVALLHSNFVNSQKTNDLVKPNVIIFYADDLGYQDTQLNNLDKPSPWETPNLLALEKDAINFTNGYSAAPTCAPSRCAILNGLHPAKTGITHVAGGTVPKDLRKQTHMPPYYPEGLAPEHFTIAEALKMNGYKTGHVGKWHAGHLKIHSSTKQGFDFAHESRGAHQGPKKGGNRLNRFATKSKNDPYQLSKEKYYPTTKESPEGISYPNDEVTENALDFIRRSKNEPFFLYLAHWMVHYPIHTKNRELLQYYCDKLGMDFPKEDIPMTKEGQNNPYYGAMVTTLDWSLGRVVDLLKKTDDPRNPGKKLYETTYIIFSSDNGGAEKHKTEIMTDNAPLDKGKQFCQEGGIRVPMLITGPNVSRGKTFDGLINQLDFYPTILNLTNSKIPKKYKSDLDGIDITGVLVNNETEIKNESGELREDLWWHFPHNREEQMQSALRAGDYKLYKNLIKGDYELYRLYKNGKRADIEERFNIASEFPEVVKDLANKLEKHLKDANAKYPYKSIKNIRDASDKIKATHIPVIITDSFDKKSRNVSIKLMKGKSKVIESYALAKLTDKPSGKKKTRVSYIKVPVEISKDKLSYNFTVPKAAVESGIVLIDENRFMVKGEFHKVK